MKHRPVKVGIAGTHSTGKSTLLRSLENAFKAEGLRVTWVKGLAEAARAEGLPILKEQNEDTARWIIEEGIRREAVAIAESDIVLVDRAVIDALGYLEAALHVTGRSRVAEQFSALEERALAHCKSYDILVVTKLDEAIPIGEGRDSDTQFRVAADKHVSAFAAKLDRSCLIMSSGNRDVIHQQVLALARERRFVPW
jgi:predicted ATPase